MGAYTGVQWTDRTFNWWIGCTKISPACVRCYAAGINKRFSGGVNWGAGALRHKHGQEYAQQLQRWNRHAQHTGLKRRVFVASMSDWLDNEVPADWRTELCDMIANAPYLRFQMLTKRIGNLQKLAPPSWLNQWPRHVGVMATIADQDEADRDLPKLTRLKLELGLPWIGLSCEPLLAPINLREHVRHLDLVIAGGEAGPCSRAMHPAWPRTLRDQCVAAFVPFFFKQWGAYRPARTVVEAAKHHVLVSADPLQQKAIGQFRAPPHLIAAHIDGTGASAAQLCAMVRMTKGQKLQGLNQLLDGHVWDQMPPELCPFPATTGVAA